MTTEEKLDKILDMFQKMMTVQMSQQPQAQPQEEESIELTTEAGVNALMDNSLFDVLQRRSNLNFINRVKTIEVREQAIKNANISSFSKALLMAEVRRSRGY